jgi:transaldolase|tara:strand:+ start:763 stop:1623 length:861 start_codon:yes stop_codon:yes gene_type:complete
MARRILLLACLSTGAALAPRTRQALPGIQRRRAAVPDLVTTRGECRLFLDTADRNEWRNLLSLGIFYGITTNPTLLEKATVPCTLPSIANLADEAFSFGIEEFMVQSWGDSAETLLENGLLLNELDPDRVVVKVPVTPAGTRAAVALIDEGVRVCLTASYAREQALIAGAIGAEYIAPYLGRMTDAGKDGVEECEAMQSIVDGVGAGTRILVASIRQPSDLSTLAAQGLDTFTFSPKIARSLFAESLTTKAAESFERAAARGGAYETAIDPLGEDLFVNGIEDEDF